MEIVTIDHVDGHFLLKDDLLRPRAVELHFERGEPSSDFQWREAVQCVCSLVLVWSRRGRVMWC